MIMTDFIYLCNGLASLPLLVMDYGCRGRFYPTVAPAATALETASTAF